MQGKKYTLSAGSTKKFKSDEYRNVKVKLSANQQYVLVCYEGKAEVTGFNLSGGIDEDKYAQRNDYTKATADKSYRFNLDVGNHEILYWDGQKIVAGDIENYNFSTYSLKIEEVNLIK